MSDLTEVARPSVSVIINTDGRAKALATTLEGLARLKYTNFEICIVCGPTPDGTREYVAALGDSVKSCPCPVRNLSQSRNLGIALASGDIVAFIDDDGVPEPEWLDELVVPFADPQVGGAGGLVYDHTGYSYQYRYAACDRLGNALVQLQEPATEWNYPYAVRFPYVQGTNSAFRRSAIVEIGGFDEEYEFYLDETDVCARMVDAGYAIAQLPNACVHHKFLPSHIRNEGRVTVHKYAVMKNKIYFSFVNNHGHFTMNEIVADNLKFVQAARADLEWHAAQGYIDGNLIALFDKDAERAWKTGLARGLDGTRRTQPADYFANPPQFRPHPTLKADGPRRTIVLLSQSYPPAPPGGVQRYTHEIARGLAALGHDVHVLTRSPDVNRVDLEEGVWVHRICPRDQAVPLICDGKKVPDRIWNHSATMLEETHRIAKSRRVDVVEGVSWDCETAAFVIEGSFPTATNIVTSLANWLETHNDQHSDAEWMASFGAPMLALERLVLEKSDRIIAASDAIVESLSEHYNVAFESERLVACPHGLADMEPLARSCPAALRAHDPSSAGLSILFVGRLELRKGIDVFMAAAETLLDAYPDVQFWIAGDNSLALDGGLTARAQFMQSDAGRRHADRVHFLGEVSDEELCWLYAQCDIFAAPSRFESFGLILIEAMMFSKPVIGARAGGMMEIVNDGQDGLLVAPGDSGALADALARLIADPDLRASLGAAGRKTFEEIYEVGTVARQRVAALSQIMRDPVDLGAMGEGVRAGEIDHGDVGYFLGEGIAHGVSVSGNVAYITFFTHDWSGIAEVSANGQHLADFDLYSQTRGRRTFRVTLPQADARLSIRRKGRKNPRSHADEVIIVSIATGGS